MGDSTKPESMQDKLFNVFGEYSVIIFTFMLGLFSAWSWALLPHHIIKLFETNRKAQLVVLFLLVLFNLDFFNPETAFSWILMKSFLVFSIYLLITKQSLPFFVATTVMFIINAFSRNNLKRYELLIKAETDEVSKQALKTKQAMFITLNKLIMVITVLIASCGIGQYFIKQYSEYAHTENIVLFLLRYMLEGNVLQQKTTGFVINL